MSTITKTEEYKEDITLRIIEALKQGPALWRRDWSSPFNPVSNVYYGGLNAMILAAEADKLSSIGDCRWVTKRQAELEGWKIKAGAEPVKIIFKLIRESSNKSWKSAKEVKSQNEKTLKPRKTLIRKTVELYHASQIKGIPGIPRKQITRIMSNQEIDKIIFNSSANIFEGGFEAYYSTRNDQIVIPRKSSFDDAEGYYSTLLHELAHWTGHKERLDRFVTFNEGSKDYAREELVAELASMFLSAATGLVLTQEHFDNHAAYIDSWIHLLKSDYDEIFKAEKAARKAAEFILAFKDMDSKTNHKRSA